MQAPANTFKQRLSKGQRLVGLWCSLPGGYAAEIIAGAGYDWLLFDTEHSPGDPITVITQLQAVAAYPIAPVVRPASNDAVLIKRFLDVGAQTLLIPYVENAEDARRTVSAMLYPPHGIRGVAGLTRASRFGRVQDYGARAAEELCLLVQVETCGALENLEEIAAVEGVDGVFIGPSDLAASMGHVGKADHPEVMRAVRDAVVRLRRIGKPSGLLTSDAAFATECLGLGANFVAVGVDIGLLARSAEKLVSAFSRPDT